MKTKYTDKIITLLDHKISFEEFEEWYHTLDFLEHPDILREMTALIKERNAENTITDAESKIYNAEIDALEDLILNHKLTVEMLSIEEQQVELEKQKLKEDLVRLRSETLNRLKNKKGSKVLLVDTAKKLISTEKIVGIYDAENWKDVLGMLWN